MTTTKPTLLCVDDEQLIVNAMQRLFRQDYTVLTATSGEDALKLLMHNKVDVIVSDQRMPGMRGVDFLRRARDISPHSMRILLTGYSDLSAIVSSVNEGEVFRYITKPWKNEVLRYTVEVAAKAAAASAQEHSKKPSDSSFSFDLTERETGPDKTMADLLVIDTDIDFHKSVKRAYGEGGGKLFHAGSMSSALDLLERHPTIGVIISEVRIERDDITDLLTTIKAFHPTITTIVASSYSDASMVIRLINEGQIYRYINKPVDEEEIVKTLETASKLHFLMRKSHALTQRHQVDDTRLKEELKSLPKATLTATATATLSAATKSSTANASSIASNNASVAAAQNPSTAERRSFLSRVRSLFGTNI